MNQGIDQHFNVGNVDITSKGLFLSTRYLTSEMDFYQVGKIIDIVFSVPMTTRQLVDALG